MSCVSRDCVEVPSQKRSGQRAAQFLAERLPGGVLTMALSEDPGGAGAQGARQHLAGLQHMEVVDVEVSQASQPHDGVSEVGSSTHPEIDDLDSERSNRVRIGTDGSAESHPHPPLGRAHLFANDLIDRPLGTAYLTAPEEVKDAVSTQGFLPMTKIV
jgi:hypothetical protein